LLRRRETFALESTLSGKTYIRLFRQALNLGYEIELHYLWLSTPQHAINRVRLRVKQGGHHVPAADIRRRFNAARSICWRIIFRSPAAGSSGTAVCCPPNDWQFSE